MRAVAGEHRVMRRAGTRFRKLHLGGMLRSHEPPPQDAACDARLHTATSPVKRSIFGIAGDRPCTPWLSPHQLPQALWEDIWERIDMPNQNSYEVSIHPNPTPDEPMPDPAVGGRNTGSGGLEPCLSALRIHTLGVDCVRKMASQSILHIVGVCINRIGTVGTRAGISRAKRKRWPKQSPCMRRWSRSSRRSECASWSRSSPRNRIGKSTLETSLSKRTADPPMAPAGCSAGAIIAVVASLCNGK